MKRPHIFFSNGRWHVYAPPRACIGFILMKSAYGYAEAVWRRRGK